MLVLMRFIVINEYPYTCMHLHSATCSCTASKSSNGNKERYVMDRWCVRDFVRGNTHVVLFSHAERHSAQQCRHSNAITPWGHTFTALGTYQSVPAQQFNKQSTPSPNTLHCIHLYWKNAELALFVLLYVKSLQVEQTVPSVQWKQLSQEVWEVS